MCYPKPGPRCSNHAKKNLDDARRFHNRAVGTQDFETFSLARARLAEALEQYAATPAGLKELQGRIDVADSPEQKLRAVVEHGEAAGRRIDQIRAYKAATGMDVSDQDGGQEHQTEESEASLATKLEKARSEVRKQAGWNRQRAGRVWETLRNTDSIGRLEDGTQMAKARVAAVLNPDDPANRHSIERITISDEIEKQKRKYAALDDLERNSGGDSATRDQITRVREGLNQKIKALRYDLDLLSTDPNRDVHPQITKDREEASRRWALTGAISRLLA